MAGDAAAASINREARRIARMIRICVPQRHKLGSISARICASVGLAFRCSNACARMIMPAMQ
jgi:hypothetical protein